MDWSNTVEIQALIASRDYRSNYRNRGAGSSVSGSRNLPGSTRRHGLEKNTETFWKVDIGRLKTIEIRCRLRGGRGGLYRYLTAVFRFHERLKRWQKRELRRYCIQYAHPQHKRAYDEFRILIDATSNADNKTRSRWAQALRYAFNRREEWRSEKTLKRFFMDNGGVAGCARVIAKPRKKRVARPVRYWA